MQKNFVIYTLDQSYGEKLLELAILYKEKGLNYYLFHELEPLEGFMKENQIYYLIQGREIPVQERNSIEGKGRFLLTEEILEEGEEGEVPVYKYQRGENILCKILTEQEASWNQEHGNNDRRIEGWKENDEEEKSSEIKEESISEGINEEARELKREIGRRKDYLIRERSSMGYRGVDDFGKRERRGKVIGIYSPIHRIGKTKFAIELGKEMGREESVLYINLEPFARGGYFHEREEGDLGNLLYFGSQENQNLGLCISIMVEQMDKLDYIKPMVFIEDLFRVEGKMWKEVIAKILEESIYTTIILDISDGIKDLFGLLEFCDTVYTLYIEEPIAMDKLKQYTDNLIKTGYDSVLEHTIQKKVELR